MIPQSDNRVNKDKLAVTAYWYESGESGSFS